ncbi:MAG: lipoprotein [Gammaproteobacteria bacterium]
MNSHLRFALIAAAALIVCGCGQTGALYLPGDVPAATEDNAESSTDDSEREDTPSTNSSEAP